MCCTAGKDCAYKHAEQLSALTKAAAMTSTHFQTADTGMLERFKAALAPHTYYDLPTDASDAPNTKGGIAREEGQTGTICPTHQESPLQLLRLYREGLRARRTGTEGQLSSEGRHPPRSTSRAYARLRPPLTDVLTRLRVKRTSTAGLSPGAASMAPKKEQAGEEQQSSEGRHPPRSSSRAYDGEADMGPRAMELEDDLPLQPDPDPPAHTPAEPSEDYDENEAFIPLELLYTLEQLQQRICVLFRESADAVKSRHAIALIGRAYRRGDGVPGLEAIKAVGDFHFPPETLVQHEEEYVAAGEDLDLMCALRIAARHTARLNPSRVQQCISADNPQRELLLEFATRGVDVRTILPPAKFQHNGDDFSTWPRQTADYKRASSVVNSLLWKSF
ncbi:hypothetical protein B484DRAFT_406739, partial [Ochromonadaceae sp. CCMP2298]